MTPWIDEAKKHIGLREIKGIDTNLTIKKWLSNLRAWWSDDETPWCGVFVAHCMKSAGYELPKHWYRAKDWMNWGVKSDTPYFGCVVIFERSGGGHVGFVVGKDKSGRLMVLGGNQNNMVSIAPFNIKERPPSGYRMPLGALKYEKLPIISTTLNSSSNEA